MKKQNLTAAVLSLVLTLSVTGTGYAGTVIQKNHPDYVNALTSQTKEVRTIPIAAPVDGAVGGAAAMEGIGNKTDSPYYKAPDYYTGGISPTLILLPHFKTYQQTSERSCGASCVLMGLNRLGITDVSEAELDREMDIRYLDNPQADGSYGASTHAVAKAFSDRGFTVQSSLTTADADGVSFTEEAFSAFLSENLAAGNLVITENVEWGGHWMVLIGYDSMGTESYSDDVVVFADPYDTTDHMQDGYLTRSFERFFATWYDHQIMPQSERVQQYVLVQKKQ